MADTDHAGMCMPTQNTLANNGYFPCFKKQPPRPVLPVHLFVHAAGKGLQLQKPQKWEIQDEEGHSNVF